jgi:membrane associated rhomboid family serine protease
MIKSPHLRALIRMVLYIVIIGGSMMGIAYGLNYIYITYGAEGITKTVAAILGLIFGGLTYSAILDEERKKEENPDD